MEPGPNGQPDPTAAQFERDAIRIQAAAVAAQQMSLSLEEDRLRQRSAALERQEAQLSAHLEERRQRLLELQEQVRKDRAALRAESAARKLEWEAQQAALSKERAEAVAAGEAAQQERTRLVELRKRLRLRWRRHWDARDAELGRREKDLAARRGGFAEEVTALQQERATLLQAQLRNNGEVELSRRQLQDAREELSLGQQEWDACLNAENALRQRRVAELDARAVALAAAERAIAERERLSARKLEDLTREIEGLEQRVQNQRAKLSLEQAVELPAIPPIDVGPRLAYLAVHQESVPETIHRVAADLADQRRHLLEQWGRLLSVQEHWATEHSALLGDVDAAASRLDERERNLDRRESDLAADEAALRHAREAADRIRSGLEGWQARLAMREASFDGDREILIAEVQARVESATKESARLQELRQRWGIRRRTELDELRSVRARCETARASYLALWKGCRQRRDQLGREQRDLAARALAIEQLREELLSRAPDAAASERRLDKLEQRNLARYEHSERELAEEHQALRSEIDRLEGEWSRVQAEERATLERQLELGRLRDEIERSTAAISADSEGREAEVRRLRDLQGRDSRELTALRDELERIASHLIGSGDDQHVHQERNAA